MANWFQKLSLVAQQSYVAKHPNSIYAKRSRNQQITDEKGSLLLKRKAKKERLKAEVKALTQKEKDCAKALEDYEKALRKLEKTSPAKLIKLSRMKDALRKATANLFNKKHQLKAMTR